MPPNSFISDNGLSFLAELESGSRTLVNTKLGPIGAVTSSENQKICSEKASLFPSGFILDKENAELLRSLCVHSQASLKASQRISSHRRFLGPLIVKLKQLTRPLVRIHIEPTLEGIEQFQTHTVYALARLIALQPKNKDHC